MFKGYDYSFAENIAPQPSPNTQKGIQLSGTTNLLSNHQPTAIILFGWYTMAHQQVIKAAIAQKTPIVLRGESTLIMNKSWLKQLIKAIYFPSFFKKFTHFLSIGKENTNFYKHYGVDPKHITLAPYSIDTAFFEEQYSKNIVAQDRASINIGFSGKFIEKKRPLDLIAAVAKSAFKERIKLHMIGDGPLMEKAAALAKKEKVNVNFLGFLNQSVIVAKGYSKMDILVLPSGDYETWGLVVNEAMTGGIPAIVSNKVGCHSDLIDETTGFVFESGNIVDLTNKIDLFCTRHDSNFPYKANVLQKIKDYSLTKTVEGFLEVITKAIKYEN
ncbi:glycosyltransferase family 4 protein [Pedobacter sp. UBA4863]|nr:glycosyltransferase family 4 protein [Pedobacter sp. UBA4863]